MGIAYFRIDEVPDKQYFRCEKLHATLSTDACEANWRRANSDPDSVSCCRRCPVGALHSGEVATSLSPFRGSKICARCHRVSTRLVGKHLCVSCWNREREIRIGRNAKGTVPSKLYPLNARRIVVVEDVDGGTRRVLSRAMTYAPAELFIAALRDSQNMITFCFDGISAAQFSQLRLF